MKARPVREFMTSHPHSIGVDQKLSKAHELMREHGIRHLPVLHGGKVVGMLSLRDLHLIETLTDVNVDEVTVEEAMTADPYCVGPDKPIGDLAAEMADQKYGAAIVMEGNRVVGLFTTIDALRALSAAMSG
jgi:acetoin utilization protein AcuB